MCPFPHTRGRARVYLVASCSSVCLHRCGHPRTTPDGDTKNKTVGNVHILPYFSHHIPVLCVTESANNDKGVAHVWVFFLNNIKEARTRTTIQYMGGKKKKKKGFFFPSQVLYPSPSLALTLAPASIPSMRWRWPTLPPWESGLRV